jgi:hypothetical protein
MSRVPTAVGETWFKQSKAKLFYRFGDQGRFPITGSGRWHECMTSAG